MPACHFGFFLAVCFGAPLRSFCFLAACFFGVGWAFFWAWALLCGVCLFICSVRCLLSCGPLALCAKGAANKLPETSKAVVNAVNFFMICAFY